VQVIGLMSGTSADGVDAALVEWPGSGPPAPFRLLAEYEEPLPADLQQRIHDLAAGRVSSGNTLRELAALDVELGERFAASALAVAERAGVAMSDVAAIASHGQTVAHYPEVRATLQIGDPSVIAERTGCLTIADFRTRDLAAGGEGAPLAPFFHLAAFGAADEGRLILNLGGIANVTWLPPGGDPDGVIAFDVGPANSLIDGVIVEATAGAQRMDVDGVRARRGDVDAALLAALLDDDFLERPPPKSTGRERYGAAEAEILARRWSAEGRAVDDLVATLVAFMAESVAHATRVHLGGVAVSRLVVGGGGARNPAVMDALAGCMPGAQVQTMDALGVPAGAAEAMAFSLMGRNALLGLPNHLPRCTGARHAAVLGEWVPPGPGWRGASS
jgi:anhydro-N-acetylmuramic acid kinase